LTNLFSEHQDGIMICQKNYPGLLRSYVKNQELLFPPIMVKTRTVIVENMKVKE